MQVHKKRAIFLDRDGVINPVIFHQPIGLLETPFTASQFRLLPRVSRAVRAINQMGWKAIVISNQPGVAMRHFTRKTLSQISRKMTLSLGRSGARLDGIYYCLHHPVRGIGVLKRKCGCRKPKPGLLIQAAREHGIDLKGSYFVGDSMIDVEAGRRAGCRTVLLGHLRCDLCALMARRGVKPHYWAGDLWAAVQKIQKLEKTKKR